MILNYSIERKFQYVKVTKLVFLSEFRVVTKERTRRIYVVKCFTRSRLCQVEHAILSHNYCHFVFYLFNLDKRISRFIGILVFLNFPYHHHGDW